MYRDAIQWKDIRRRIHEKGVPKKQVARETGISRHTINKMLAYEHPPGYKRRPPRHPKLGPYISTIERLLRDIGTIQPAADQTIRDIFDRLRREEGFTGSYDSVWN